MRMRLLTCLGLCAVFLLVSCEKDPQTGPVRTEYTVTFRTGSGGTPIADKKVPEGFTLDLELSEYQPERKGYSFEGWSVTNTATLITEITVTGNISLTAQWMPNVSVTLYMRGGTLDVDDPGADIRPGDYFEAEWYTPSLKGFVFLYWHLENDPRQEEVKRIQVYDNITLAAKWEAGWVVTFDLGDDEAATLHEGGYVTVAKNSTLDLTTIRPVRDNYVHEGWYYEAAFTTRVPDSIRVTGSIPLYAKWVPLDYFKPLFGVWTGREGTYLLYHDPDGSSLTKENGLIGFYFSEDEICSFVWTAEKINGKPWTLTSGTLTVGEGAGAGFTMTADSKWPEGNETISKLWVKGKDDDIVSLNLFETGNGTLEANGRSFWLSYVLSGGTLYLLQHNTDEFDDHLPGEVLLEIPAIEGVLFGFEEKVFDGEGEGEGVL